MSLENMKSGSREEETKEAYVAFDGQVRSRDRVRNLAEVLTHEREVKAMLDLVPEMFPSTPWDRAIDRKFFEPAVGTGNFVEEILRRKLKYVDYERGDKGRAKASRPFLFKLMRAVASIYAVDIDESNVEVTKDRIRWIIRSHIDLHMNTVPVPVNFWLSLNTVLEDNIQQGNTLTDMGDLLWVDYHPSRDFHFRRTWSLAGSDEVVMRNVNRRNGYVYYNALYTEAAQPVRVVVDEGGAVA